MERPNYDDATAGSHDHFEPSDAQAETTGWLQHGRDLDDVRTASATRQFDSWQDTQGH